MCQRINISNCCDIHSLLDRDPKRLGIMGMEADVRRVAFWELKSIEHWQVSYSIAMN